MTGRQTIVVHTRLGGHMVRVEAARAGADGVRILTMGHLAARLAGGFIQPIDPEALYQTIRDSLAANDLGELESIKALPGMARAVVTTLEKVWRAGIELSTSSHPRLKALAALERDVLRRLPPSMKRPAELVDLARSRIRHAPAVLGEVEIHGHSEMPICWRALLSSLAQATSVVWIAGSRSVPNWLSNLRIEVRRTAPSDIIPILNSCAMPQHEVLEAFRWMRGLLAAGKATPDQIGIAAASPADFDDHVLALAQDANIPLHFVHGIEAAATPDGQTAAALADILVRGISQGRVRRLFRRLHGTPVLSGLPDKWTRILPPDAPLATIERWERVLADTEPGDWPDGLDRSGLVLDILRLLAKGPGAAAEAGERLLPALPRQLWRRALEDGPPAALPVTLASLRIQDGLEPASHPIWASAVSLASAPRPFVRLLGLNAGRWPRRISEDRLIPDHIIPIEELDPLPLADADRRDFATIIASAQSATISFSRRDVEGRLLGRSPLVAHLKEIYLNRSRTPEHAASDADRLLARPTEFRATAIARSGLGCWQDWYQARITPHDGLVGRPHPRLQKALGRTMSATSLRLLLRDPIRFTWRYALGWRQPEEVDEPLTLDALAFGNLVHEILQTAVSKLESDRGFGSATAEAISKAVEWAVGVVAGRWETGQPVPPPVIWRKALDSVCAVSTAALTYPLDALPDRRTWTEVPFGTGDAEGRNDLPWNPACPVEIPGTGILIQSVSGLLIFREAQGGGLFVAIAKTALRPMGRHGAVCKRKRLN